MKARGDPGYYLSLLWLYNALEDTDLHQKYNRMGA